MDTKDEQKFGLYVLWGLAIGSFIGAALGAVNGNIFTGFWYGALSGVFVGWIAAAAKLKIGKNS